MHHKPLWIKFCVIFCSTCPLRIE